jgi:hypothetical protein
MNSTLEQSATTDHHCKGACPGVQTLVSQLHSNLSELITHPCLSESMRDELRRFEEGFAAEAIASHYDLVLSMPYEPTAEEVEAAIRVLDVIKEWRSRKGGTDEPDR